MNWVLKLVINTLAVFATAWLLGDAVLIHSFWTAILVALVLALLNFTIKPILVLFTLPATIFTFGLFLLVINAFVIMIADWLIGGFDVRNFWWALLFSLMLSLINSIMMRLGERRAA